MASHEIVARSRSGRQFPVVSRQEYRILTVNMYVTELIDRRVGPQSVFDTPFDASRRALDEQNRRFLIFKKFSVNFF